jgi:hypothetical protein
MRKEPIMRRTAFLLVFSTILSLGAFCSAAATGQGDPEGSQIEQLSKQIAQLQRRVEALEKRLAERQRPSRPIEPPSLVLPRSSRPPRQSRPGWQRREFNGVPYYIIPIEQQSRSRPATRRPKP